MMFRGMATAAAVLASSSVLAEGRSEVMMDLMGRVPAAAFDNFDSPAQVRFADQDAVRSTLGPLPEEAAANESARSAPFLRVDSGELSMSSSPAAPGEWERLVGFGEGDVWASLAYGDTHTAVTMLRLTEEAAARVAPALVAQGYAEEAQGSLTALARGEDNEMSLADRVEGDPLGGAHGKSSRVALDGTLLVQARNWPALLGHFDSSAPRGHPDLGTMAEVIDRPEWGDVQLLQAATLYHQTNLSHGAGGIPVWQLGLMADLSSATETVTLVMFSYSSRADAETAVAHIAAGWNEPGQMSGIDAAMATMMEGGDVAEIEEAVENAPPSPSMLEATGTEAETGVSGDGPFVAWVALRRAPEATNFWPDNRSYSVLRRMMWDADLMLFGYP